MGTLYNNKELTEALQNGTPIQGEVSLELRELVNKTKREIESNVIEKLVGKEYVSFIQELNYRIVGVDVEKNAVHLHITVDATKLASRMNKR